MPKFVGELEELELGEQRKDPTVDRILIWRSEGQVCQNEAKGEETACCVGNDDLDRIQSVDRCYVGARKKVALLQYQQCRGLVDKPGNRYYYHKGRRTRPYNHSYRVP